MTTYDLEPTARLKGLHMVGNVRRRFLVTYPVDPARLEPAVPPGGELSLHDGLAWVSACFVDLADMRPSFVPQGLGSGFFYLIHRTRARLPYPDGALRESVLVLEANMNRPLLARLGRATSGVGFRIRDITLVENEEDWELSMRSEGSLLYRAIIAKSSIGDSLPSGSRFAGLSQADDFLLGVSYGGEWDRKSGRLRLLAETHDPWMTLAGECRTECFDYLEKLATGTPQADHVVTMTDIPHYFALRGLDISCPAREAVGA